MWAAWSRSGMTFDGAGGSVSLPPVTGGSGSGLPRWATAATVLDPYTVTPATEGKTETTQDILARSGIGLPYGTIPGERPAFTRDFSGGYSVRELKQDVARSVGSRISGWQPGPDLATDSSGVMRHVIEGVPSGPPASPEEIASFTRWGRVSGSVKSFVGSLGEGNGVMQSAQTALPGGAAKALGYAGAAVALGNEGLNYAASQRDVNRGWQKILGGDNVEGFSERARSQVFEWGLKGVMGSDTASELYRGAAEVYGTNREARASAQSFGVDMFKKYGMDVADSLALVETAARQGNEGLAGLRDAIEGVSETARRAGVNVQSAQKVYAQNLENLTGVATGSTATSIAGVLTEAQVGLNHQFEGVDFSGMTSTSNMYRMAAMSGMNAADFQARFGTDSRFAGQALTGGLRSASLGLLRTFGGEGAVEMIRSRISEIQASDRDVTNEDWMSIGSDLQSQYNITPQMVQQVMDQMGVSGLTPMNAVAFLARTTDDRQFDFLQKIEDERSAMSESKQLDLDPEERLASNRSGDIAKIRERLGGKRVGGEGDTGILADKDDRARNLYIAGLMRGEKTNPVLESLIKDFEGARRFRVKTKDGERIVTTDDLIRYYGDQAFSGDVEIVRGTVGDSGAGSTLAEALGLSDANTGSSAASSSQGARGGKATSDDWAGKGKYAEGTTGRVEIVLKGRVAQYFDTITTGSAYSSSVYEGIPLESGRPSDQAPSGN